MRSPISPIRPFVALAIAAGLSLAAFSALADRPATDRTVAQQVLAQHSSDAAPASSALARPLSEARAALARADNAIAAGDSANARLLEGLAREWAELASDASRASQAERDAVAKQQAAAEASKRVQRARAMLDELAARKARAQGELNQWMEKTNAGAAPGSSGKPAPKAPPKAAPPAPPPAKGGRK